MVAQKYQNELERVKKNVEQSYEYFRTNYERYNEYRKFVFNTSLSDDDISLLKTLNKPQLEFNILEAYISRLRGEFSKQEPSVNVMSEDDAQIDPAVIQVVEGHLRHLFTEANKNSFEYNVYTDLLSGGFSAIKVWTDYASPMSFKQVIKFDRVYDPTLCGWDPTARLSHKGDGQYCFECYPKTKKVFEVEYPNIDLRNLKFVRENQGFNWSYRNQKEDVLIICDYYEKKKKKVKIVQLANGMTETIDEYNKFLEQWNNEGYIEQPPAIVGAPRMTEIDVICRYRYIEDRVLEYVETDYKHLPVLFVDGNSILLRDSINGSYYQMTRPYVYHAKGVQRLKNFAGQTLANELENMVQHKFKVAKESIPDEKDYQEAYTNVQQASTLVYNAFKENDPNVPVPPPMEIARVPSPPEVTNTFSMSDQVTQNILGSYDAALGINDNQLSGVAIVEAATQSNSAAMPYIVGFMQALTQLANIVVDLIPKYYKTPRTIPVLGLDGKRTFAKINQQGGIDLSYSDSALQVKVESGVNFQIQKARALQQIIALMQVSPIFAQFMNQEGLGVLLDNIEIRGIDQLKSMTTQFQQKMQQMQQQQMQMAQQEQQNNPLMLSVQNERMRIEQQGQKDQAEMQVKAADVSIKKQNADTQRLKAMAEIGEMQDKVVIAHDKAQAEETRAAVDMAIKNAELHHKMMKDRHE